MLEDRSYMRRDGSESRASACVILIVFLAVVFLFENTGGARALDFNKYLALSKDGLRSFYFWQIFTFQFLHAGPWPLHLIGNCFVLWIFGREVEQALGPKNFLKLYFLSGTIGGLLQAVVLFVPVIGTNAPVIGASANVSGVVAAYALLFPHRELMFLFLPIRIKAYYLLWGLVALSIFGTVLRFDNVAHAAHLGGIIGGLAYLRWGMQAEEFFAQRRSRRVRFRPRELIKVPLGKNAPWQRAKDDFEDLNPEEFISREVDPILEKISAHGIQSLTPREREILQSARSKIEKR
jgi:membrane associated rhomboid family serine protease